MGSRSPLRGYNHNIRYLNRIYHVQTEDSGLDNPHIFTHVFLEGQIISSSRTEYADIVADPDNEKKVRKLMQRQHKTLMKQLRRGEFDDKIVAIMGSLEPPEISAEIPAAAAAEPATAAPEPAVAAPPPAEPPVAVPSPLAPEPAVAGAEAEAEAEEPATTIDTRLPAAAADVAEVPDTEKMPAVAEVATKSDALEEVDTDPHRAHDTDEVPAIDSAQLSEPEPEPVPVKPAARPPRPLPIKPIKPPPSPPKQPVAVARPVSVDNEVTEALDIRALKAKRAGEVPPPPELSESKTMSIDIRALHGFDRHSNTAFDLPLFPPDEEVSVIVDGPPKDPSAAGTYSQVYRKSSEAPLPKRRRIETPLPGRPRSSLHQKSPIRRPSRVFGQPLPGSTRYPSSNELPSVGALPRKSGVYLVPGGPPQRPPHPDPKFRQLPESKPQRVSSPQRYTAPTGGNAPGAPRPKRQTGAYEVPVKRAPSARPRPASQPSAKPAPIRPKPPVQRETPAQMSPVAKKKPPTSPLSRRSPPPPRTRPPQQVVARPVVVVGTPVDVGTKARKQEARAPTPPPVTPESVPRARRASKPKEPASVFGSDLISERSLDEVILAYLAEDSEGGDEE
jgi:hypothetical protein